MSQAELNRIVINMDHDCHMANDNIINWWIMKMCFDFYEVDPDFALFFFSTYVLHRFQELGIEKEETKARLSKWLRYSVNLFDYKFIVLPYFKDVHWSIIVVVNPLCLLYGASCSTTGAVEEGWVKHLDSSPGLHKSVDCCLLVSTILNVFHHRMSTRKGRYVDAEWNETLEAITCRVTKGYIQPDNYRQQNGYDCGFYALISLRQFLQLESLVAKGRSSSSSWSAIIRRYSSVDIVSILRSDMAACVANLTEKYREVDPDTYYLADLQTGLNIKINCFKGEYPSLLIKQTCLGPNSDSFTVRLYQ